MSKINVKELARHGTALFWHGPFWPGPARGHPEILECQIKVAPHKIETNGISSASVHCSITTCKDHSVRWMRPRIAFREGAKNGG